MEIQQLDLSQMDAPKSMDMFKNKNGENLPSVIAQDISEQWFHSDTYYPQYYKAITNSIIKNKLQEVKLFEFGVRSGYIPIVFKRVLQSLNKTGEYFGMDNNTYVRNGLQLTKETLDIIGLKNTLIEAESKSYDFTRFNKQIDIIHIDGEHTWDGKISDLKNAFNMIKDGGYILVDDYDNNLIKDPTDYFIGQQTCEIKMWHINTFRGLLVIKKM